MPGGATPSTAYDIGILPKLGQVKSYTEAPGTWWFKYTPPRDGVIGCRAYGVADAQIDVFYGDPTSLGTLDDWFFLVAPNTRPATVPTVQAETLYFMVDGSGGLMTVDFYQGPTAGNFPAGSLFVPDDTAFEYPESSGDYLAFPGAVLDPDTAEVLRLQIDIPACEAGDTLVDGSIILDKTVDSSQVHIFSNALNHRISVAPPMTPDSGGSRHHFSRYAIDSWMVATRSSTWQLWTVDRDGQVSQPFDWDLGVSTLHAIGANRTAQLVYFATAATTAPVEVYDLNDFVTTTLVAGVTGYTVLRDSIIVLADNTILVGYVKISPRDGFVRHYASDGSTIQTYAISSDPQVLDRIARDLTDATFWAWVHEFITPNETSRFQQIQILDGDILKDIAPAYQSNAGIGPLLATPPQFGHSFSCPFMILRQDCACPDRTEWGGGRGYSGGVLNQGDDPMRDLAAFNAMCAYGGDVPNGTDGTDTENWAD